MAVALDKQQYMDLLRTEWKRLAFYRDLLAEFWGTFMLTAVSILAGQTWGQPGMGNAVQVGLAMTFFITMAPWQLGEFGGCSMNPAITLALTCGARITALRCVVYWVVECGGGITAAYFVVGVTPANYTGSLGLNQLGPEVQPWQGVVIETFITMNLCMSVLAATNSDRKPDLYIWSTTIGMSVGMGIFCAFVSTGASMNPARSLGPAVATGIWIDYWVYVLGPMAGGALAGVFYPWVLEIIDKPPYVRKRVVVVDEDRRADEAATKKLAGTSYDNNAYIGEDIINGQPTQLDQERI